MRSGLLVNEPTMNFSESEKTAITSIWGKVESNAVEIGAEALERLFLTFPQTKINFSNLDLSPGSKDVKELGGKIMRAIGNAALHLDDIGLDLSILSELHALTLKFARGTFRLLSHSIQVTLAAHFPQEFTTVVQADWDRFLSVLFFTLFSKYR